MSRTRGPFSEKQRQALEAALATICLRAQAMEDRIRAMEMLLEDRGLLGEDSLSTSLEAVRDARDLESLVSPNRGSIRREVAQILAGVPGGGSAGHD